MEWWSEAYGFDVDGVVAIGRLPLVKRFTPQPFPTKNPYKQAFHMKNVEGGGIYDGYFAYKIGMTEGYNVYLYTNLEAGRMKEVFARFLAAAHVDDVGAENLHLLEGSNQNYQTILSRLSEEKANFVFSSYRILENFSTWSDGQFGTLFSSPERDVRLLASVIKMGQKQSMDQAEFQRLVDCLRADLLEKSCVHLAFTFDSPGFLALDASLFATRSPDCDVFHPLGIARLATVHFRCPHAFLLGTPPANGPHAGDFWPDNARFQMEYVTSVKVYCPVLKNPRTAALRHPSAAGKVTAHSALGLGADRFPDSSNPYKSSCQEAKQLARSYAATIGAVRRQESCLLRFEYVFKDFMALDLDRLFQLIGDHLLGQMPRLTISVPLDDIPFDQGAEQALNLIDNPEPFRYHQTACAEAYLAYLIDGGGRRIFDTANYHLLTVVLGMRLTDALQFARDNDQLMVIPQTPDFSHVQWELLNFQSLARQARYHLQLSEIGATRLLEEIMKMRPGMTFEEEGEFWLEIVRKLMCTAVAYDSVTGERRGPESLLGRGREHSLNRVISTRDLARCILFPRHRSGRGFRALQECIVRAYMSRMPETADQTPGELHDTLAGLLQRGDFLNRVRIWPLCQPIQPTDELQRFASVSTDMSSRLRVVADIHKFSPATRFDPAMDVPGFEEHLMEIQGNLPVSHVKSFVRRRTLASLWYAIVNSATVQSNAAGRRARYHVGVHRGEWENEFGRPNIRLILNSLVERGLLVRGQPNLLPSEYLFDYIYVPADFQTRLDQLLHPPPPPDQDQHGPPADAVPERAHSPVEDPSSDPAPPPEANVQAVEAAPAAQARPLATGGDLELRVYDEDGEIEDRPSVFQQQAPERPKHLRPIARPLSPASYLLQRSPQREPTPPQAAERSPSPPPPQAFHFVEQEQARVEVPAAADPGPVSPGVAPASAPHFVQQEPDPVQAPAAADPVAVLPGVALAGAPQRNRRKRGNGVGAGRFAAKRGSHRKRPKV